MLQQDTVQRATSYSPALYSAYEGERDEPQFESKQQNKWHEELITACGLIAACDARDRAGLKWCLGSGGKENTDGCYNDNKKADYHGCEHQFVVVPECICPDDEKAFGAND